MELRVAVQITAAILAVGAPLAVYRNTPLHVVARSALGREELDEGVPATALLFIAVFAIFELILYLVAAMLGYALGGLLYDLVPFIVEPMTGPIGRLQDVSPVPLSWVVAAYGVAALVMIAYQERCHDAR